MGEGGEEVEGTGITLSEDRQVLPKIVLLRGREGGREGGRKKREREGGREGRTGGKSYEDTQLCATYMNGTILVDTL